MNNANNKKEIKFNLAVLGKNKTVKTPTYGCLKNGKNPTFRQTRSFPQTVIKAPARRFNTIKHYNTCKIIRTHNEYITYFITFITFITKL